jgi:hypothetical protein
MCFGILPVGGLPPSVSRLFRQCGILNILQPYRPPRPVTGIALLFFLLLPVGGSSEHGNEPSGSITCWEVLEGLHNWWPVGRDSATKSWSLIVP